jgi:hypothetical protein
MNLKKYGVLAFAIAFALSAVDGGSESPDFDKMLKTIDARGGFDDRDFSAKVRLVKEEPGEATDVKVAQSFRRDRDDSFLILFLEPESQLGQGYLKIDDNLWFYDSGSRKFTHSSMKENMQGTDAKNSDFGQTSLSVDYRVSSSSEGKLGAYDVWVLELEAANNEVTYPYKKVSVSKQEGFMLKSEDYSLSKRLLRTAYYTSYAKLGDSYVADSIIFSDAIVKGKKTKITMTDISLDPLPDSIFTKAYVERVNR